MLPRSTSDTNCTHQRFRVSARFRRWGITSGTTGDDDAERPYPSSLRRALTGTGRRARNAPNRTTRPTASVISARDPFPAHHVVCRVVETGAIGGIEYRWVAVAPSTSMRTVTVLPTPRSCEVYVSRYCWFRLAARPAYTLFRSPSDDTRMKSPPVASTRACTVVASEATPGRPTAYTWTCAAFATAMAESAVAELEMSAPSVSTTIALDDPGRVRSSWLAYVTASHSAVP